MEKSEVIKIVCDVVRQIQLESGRRDPTLSSDSCPICDLDGFDSLSGVEATVVLSERLGIELPGVSVFVDESGKKALTVEAIATKIAEISTKDLYLKSGNKR